MSLVSTLAKVAIGVAMAKGASAMAKGSRGGTSGPDGLGSMLGSLMGGTTGGAASSGAQGGLEDLLGGLLGGSGAKTGAMSGGLGGLLEQLGGADGNAPAQGGLQDVLGGLAGAGGAGGLLGGLAGAGGAGGLLGGLASALGGKPAKNNASFGSVLNSAFDQNPEPEIEPTPDQEAAAGMMLRAMIQAAKSDGKLDDDERQKLISKLGNDVSPAEAAFVNAEMQGPVDIDGLVKQTPKGLESQIYAMSVLGIDLDSRAEAEYLHKLATGLGMNATSVNNIHQQMGVASLYT